MKSLSAFLFSKNIRKKKSYWLPKTPFETTALFYEENTIFFPLQCLM